jgi:predicted O-methyltransferase YrrM
MAVVDADRRAFAAALYAAGREHDARQDDRLARWRNVEPETAEMLAVLAGATNARRILEIGTANGYSTIWLADAAQATGAQLTSLDVEPSRTAIARENLAGAGLDGVADLRTQDAAAFLRETRDGAFDLIFLDAERDAYVGYWPDLVRALAPSGLLAVDNVISHAAQVEAFRTLVEGDGRVAQALVPIGAGVLLVVRA